MKQFLINDKGFTLIEILVTIAIVSLLLVISVPNFRDYKYKNDLSRGADLVQSAIYEAKNLALAPQTEKDKDTGYYAISFESDTNIMSLNEVKSEFVDSPERILVKKFDMPSDISFEEDITKEIVFSIEEQGKIIKPSEDAVIKIKNKKIKSGRNIKTIFVNKVTGQVNIE